MSKIAVITGSRAEYGLLSPLIKKIDQSDIFDLLLIVTGAHLSQDYGFTKSEIEAEGFSDLIEVDIKLKSSDHADQASNQLDVATNMAEALNGMAKALHYHQPDLVIVLGDRYEIFCSVQAAMLMNIPVAHIHGGEVTEGAIDDAMRHSISKMSHLHFTSTDIYRQRVIQLGEHPDRVFNVGSLGYENILNCPLLSKTELEDDLKFKFRDKNILITHHPVTISSEYDHEIDYILDAVDQIGAEVGMIFTSSNSDAGGMSITTKVKAFSDNREHCLYVDNLGLTRYLSVMKQVNGMIGNSSSGVIEAPAMGIWSLNIGPRQDGRLMPESVINAHADDNLLPILINLLNNGLPEREQQETHYFGNGQTSENILKIISNCNFKSLIKKTFYNLELEK